MKARTLFLPSESHFTNPTNQLLITTSQLFISMDESTFSPLEESTISMDESTCTPLEEAKLRISVALKRYEEEGISFQRSPDFKSFEGCNWKELGEGQLEEIQCKLLYLVGTVDKRRWTKRSGHKNKVSYILRGGCSRVGAQKFNLLHENTRTSPKCGCSVFFTLCMYSHIKE